MINLPKKSTSVYLEPNVLTAIDTYRLMVRHSDLTVTANTRSDVINQAIARYVLEATKKYVELRGENELARSILGLLKNPCLDDIFLWNTLKRRETK